MDLKWTLPVNADFCLGVKFAQLIKCAYELFDFANPPTVLEPMLYGLVEAFENGRTVSAFVSTVCSFMMFLMNQHGVNRREFPVAQLATNQKRVVSVGRPTALREVDKIDAFGDGCELFQNCDVAFYFHIVTFYPLQIVIESTAIFCVSFFYLYFRQI